MENCCSLWLNYASAALEKMWNWGVLPLTHPFWPLFGHIFSEKWEIHQLRPLFKNISKINIWKWLPFLGQARSAVSERPLTFVSANFKTEITDTGGWDTFRNFCEKPIKKIRWKYWLKIAPILKSHNASIFYLFGQILQLLLHL